MPFIQLTSHFGADKTNRAKEMPWCITDGIRWGFGVFFFTHVDRKVSTAGMYTIQWMKPLTKDGTPHGELDVEAVSDIFKMYLLWVSSFVPRFARLMPQIY